MDYLTSLYLTDAAEPQKREYRRSVQRIQRDQQISAAYKAGRPVDDIAVEFGLSRNGVYATLKRTGTPRTAVAVRTHPNSIATRQRNAEIIEKYKAGASVLQLGEEYGLTRERICQFLRPHNLTNLKAEQRRVARETIEAERARIVSELHASRSEAIARAVEIVRAGGSRNEAIRKTRLPVHLVNKACKDAGLPYHHGRWQREGDVEKRRKRATELRIAGKTWAEIKEITAAEGDTISMNYVARHFPELMTRISRPKRQNIPAAPKVASATSVAWSDDDVTKLCRMYFAGCSAQQIADVLGVTRNAIIGKTNRLRADGLLKPPAA